MAPNRRCARSGCSSPNWGERTLILASRSPQRRAILEQLGVAFRIVLPDVEELESGPAEAVAVENARRKALAVGNQDETVLAVDTVVSLDERLYGKPASLDDARGTLTALAGRRHTVLSGVCVVSDGLVRTASVHTAVQFRALDEQLLEWYLDSGEWRERAGGYAIQGRGAALVAGIEGDFFNVVGLPVPALLDLLPGLLG
ncbi:MAG: Maf family protein [Solirubrobacteraceae bacterium]